MSIAETIIQIIREESNSKIVKEVYLKISKLDQIIADSLVFYFDIIKKEYENLKNSELFIESLPLIGKCIQCKTLYSIEDPLFLCSTCNKGLEIIKGKETFIDKIIIQD